MRELLHHFTGQEVNGDLLGLFSEGQVRLPVFRQVASYCSDDGQVEVDAWPRLVLSLVEVARNGGRWMPG